MLPVVALWCVHFDDQAVLSGPRGTAPLATPVITSTLSFFESGS
jgi:hypothetical protein